MRNVGHFYFTMAMDDALTHEDLIDVELTMDDIYGSEQGSGSNSDSDSIESTKGESKQKL